MAPLLRPHSAWDDRNSQHLSPRDTTYTHHLHQVNHLNFHTKNTAPYSCAKCYKQGNQLRSLRAAWREEGLHCTLADRLPASPQQTWLHPSLPTQLSETTHWNSKLKSLTLETFHHLSWQRHLLCNGLKVYETKTPRYDPGVVGKWPHIDTCTQAPVLRLCPAHSSGWSSGISQELSVPQRPCSLHSPCSQWGVDP